MGEVGREGGDDVGRRWRGDQHVGEERLPSNPKIIINNEGEAQGGGRQGERVGGRRGWEGERGERERERGSTLLQQLDESWLQVGSGRLQ